MRVSALAEKARYAVITDEVLDEIFSDKLLAASLYAQSTDQALKWEASLIFATLAAIHDELKRRII